MAAPQAARLMLPTKSGIDQLVTNVPSPGDPLYIVILRRHCPLSDAHRAGEVAGESRTVVATSVGRPQAPSPALPRKRERESCPAFEPA